jgi:hypothetical protein
VALQAFLQRDGRGPEGSGAEAMMDMVPINLEIPMEGDFRVSVTVEADGIEITVDQGKKCIWAEYKPWQCFVDDAVSCLARIQGNEERLKAAKEKYRKQQKEKADADP